MQVFLSDLHPFVILAESMTEVERGESQQEHKQSAKKVEI